jgi:hypothetical protein
MPIPQYNTVTLALHPAAPDAPYVTHCMAGKHMFDIFDEKHVVATP